MVNEEAKAFILHTLRQAKRPVNGNALAEELGVSRVAVWKHIDALKTMGYAIVSGHSGYELTEEGDFLYPWEFQESGLVIEHHESTDSTMNRALEMAIHLSTGGNSLVIAETQTAGRGRPGKAWESSPGGLYATLSLRTITPGSGERPFGIIATLALCETLRDLTGEPFGVSWPNDIVLEGKKAAGILEERFTSGGSTAFVNVGLGVNVRSRPDESAFAIRDSGLRPCGRKDILRSFLDRFVPGDTPATGIESDWARLDSSRGALVAARRDGDPLGMAEGIDDLGNVLVSDKTGKIKRFRPDEAKLLRKECI